MPFKKLENLENKIDLILKEVHRLRQENEKYLLIVNKVQEEKKSLQLEIEEYRKQMAQITRLEASHKKMEDEKILFQSKVNDILNNLDKLDFL
jgi:regulator of replication initiation timing